MSGTLFVVGTPIGNLGDLTDRARQTLGAVAVVAAEDTRRAGRLLSSIGVRSRLISFYEGNERARVPELLLALRAGSDVAVITDAGMPGVSDPGYRLVAACVEAGIAVDVVPGPSAAIAALVVSGLPTDRFVFEGFLPRSGRARAQRLAALAAETRTIVLFESPKRVSKTLSDLLGEAGDRTVVVARELTKLHQEVLRGALSEVLGRIEGRDLKGEVSIVLEGAGRDAAGADPDEAMRLASGFAEEGMRKREAARRASELTGVPASRIYDALVRGVGPSGGGG